MSTDAGSAAAPEDAAVQEESSERPGLESADPGSADSATSTSATADRGVEGSARPDTDTDPDTARSGAGADGAVDRSGADDATDDDEDSVEVGENPADEGFVASMLRDATITGLPGETGAPPVEPHAPEAQQQGDEPVGAEPRSGDNPRGVD